MELLHIYIFLDETNNLGYKNISRVLICLYGLLAGKAGVHARMISIKMFFHHIHFLCYVQLTSGILLTSVIFLAFGMIFLTSEMMLPPIRNNFAHIKDDFYCTGNDLAHWGWSYLQQGSHIGMILLSSRMILLTSRMILLKPRIILLKPGKDFLYW